MIADKAENKIDHQDADCADEGGHRADGKVDSARDDDEGHAQRDDSGIGNLFQYIEDILELEEIGTCDRRDDEKHGQGEKRKGIFRPDLLVDYRDPHLKGLL